MLLMFLLSSAFIPFILFPSFFPPSHILPHQQDVESYRSALDKMAEDMVGLRTRVVTLEGEKSRLLANLSLHQDLGQQLLDDADIDVMTKAEIADRIGRAPRQPDAHPCCSSRSTTAWWSNALISFKTV